MRTNLEYNSSIDTSQEGQSYLRLHPEMWAYLDQQRYSNMNMKPPTSSLDGPDIIPRYPASSLLPGIGSVNVVGAGDTGPTLEGGQSSLNPGQYVPTYPGGSSVYDLNSQPELNQNIKYPSYHSVHKHGKYGIPNDGSILAPEVAGGGGMSNGNALRDLNINVDRRTLQQQQNPHGISSSNTVQEEIRRRESSVGGESAHVWPNYYNPDGERGVRKYPEEVLTNDPYAKSTLGRFRYLPENSGSRSRDQDQNEDINLGVERAEEQVLLNSLLQHPQPRWKRDENVGSNKGILSNGQNLPNRMEKEIREKMRNFRRKRHIGPHDMDGIQRLISTGNQFFPLRYG